MWENIMEKNYVGEHQGKESRTVWENIMERRMVIKIILSLSNLHNIPLTSGHINLRL